MTNETENTRLTGTDAIEYAKEHGLALSKYSDPVEGYRDDMTLEEAEDVAREDDSLIYIDMICTHPVIERRDRDPLN